MPSPFPGMDPFLEAYWGDVHTSLTTYARNQLRPQLPADLTARVEEYIVLESFETDEPQRLIPDVSIAEPKSSGQRIPATGSHTIQAASPLVIPLHTEWTERAIHIQEREGGRLITTIEFLSPGNKLSSAQRSQFREKQLSLLQAGANLVEIDLIRRGSWTVSAPEDQIPDTHAYPYRICVIRAERPRQVECYPTPLDQPLPAIRIPLRTQDDDVVLELQPLVNAAWEDGDYARIDYLSGVRPKFRTDDELWIQQRLEAQPQG